MNRKTLISWAAFDWANSAINTIVFTFVFSVYFARSVYGDEVAGSAAWSFAQGCAGIAVALTAPFFGAAIDAYGPRKPAIKIFTVLCIALTATLFFVPPDKAFVMTALMAGALLTFLFELLQSAYGMTLPVIAPPDKTGFVSGIGWGAGYVGSIVSLSIALFGFIGLGDMSGFLGISKDGAMHVRATMLLVAVWFAFFAVPFFLYCPDAAPTGRPFQQSFSDGARGLSATVKQAWAYPAVVRFLAAAAIYRDGLVTLFAVGGLYAAGTLHMSFSEVMIFAIAINIASGIGAVAFAFFDDRIGSRTTIIICLAAMILLGGAIILTNDKTAFIALACLLGLFIGPVQASSRAMLVHLAPPAHTGAFFGLYALTGKSVAFMGPFAFSVLTSLFVSQRAGMASILVFWLVGMALVFSVKIPVRTEVKV